MQICLARCLRLQGLSEHPLLEVEMHVHANASSAAHGWDKSPAQQARNTYNLEPGSGFGRIVSQIARAVYEPSNSAGPTANGDSGPGVTSTTAGDPTGGTQSATSPDASAPPTQPQSPGTVDVSV